MVQGLMTTYAPLPIQLSHGQGALVWDKEGNEYIDALGGIAVCALGHDYPEVTTVIQQQAAKLLHTSNLFEIEHQINLAKKLTKVSGMDALYCGNSGAEANEAAIKLCRLYGHKKNIHVPHIVVMEKAFHGRTLACLSASGSHKVQAGFEPLVKGFVRCPYDDLNALETILKNDHNVVAVMLEPIQGEGGIIVPSDGYLAGIRSLCDQHECLMVLDEVQTGVGRTGSFYNYQQANITPDIVTSAKALGNGIPIGVCLTHGIASDLFKPGNHGSTFGGNPLATRVACTVVDIITKNKLAQRAEKMGDKIKTYLQDALANNTHVKGIRGKGLMIGVELDKPCRDILTIGLHHGLLFSVTADSVLRLLPPYIITDEQADAIGQRLVHCINHYYE